MKTMHINIGEVHAAVKNREQNGMKETEYSVLLVFHFFCPKARLYPARDSRNLNLGIPKSTFK